VPNNIKHHDAEGTKGFGSVRERDEKEGNLDGPVRSLTIGKKVRGSLGDRAGHAQECEKVGYEKSLASSRGRNHDILLEGKTKPNSIK